MKDRTTKGILRCAIYTRVLDDTIRGSRTGLQAPSTPWQREASEA